MKKLLNSILKRRGLELRKIDEAPRASMKRGLAWLAQHGFPVETVLDVGASNGSWSLDCMACFPQAHYILFEPQPVHADELQSFAQQYPRVQIVPKAVGASEGKTFFDATDPFGGALAERAEQESFIEVALTTIDATVSERQLKSPFLLKLDTHGFEKGILEGAENTLRETQVAIIEAYNYRITDEAMLFWELCAFLHDRGFRPVDLVDVLHRQMDDSLWQMDLFFVRADWEGFQHNKYV